MSILKLPLCAVTGTQTFVMPFISYEIPFFSKETSESWKYNYYPTCFIVLITLFHESFQFLNFRNVILFG